MTQLQGFNVRRANAADILQVMQINLETLPENYPEFFFRDLLNKFPECFIVAETEGKLIGYIMCRMEGGISNFGISWVRKGHIVSVTVLPKYRRRGVATELINRAITAMAECYDAKEVILEVRVSNIAAIAIYDKLKFSKIRIIKSYYRDGEDALLMAKQTAEAH
jgi:ribosomal-protein-alanine N-acetyltransferase